MAKDIPLSGRIAADSASTAHLKPLLKALTTQHVAAVLGSQQPTLVTQKPDSENASNITRRQPTKGKSE